MAKTVGKAETRKPEVQSRLDELCALRDTIRLDLHLAGMDMRDEWHELERKLPDTSAAAAQLRELTSQALDHLAAQLRGFRARLRTSGAGVATVMSPHVVCCQGGDSLARAVILMWDHDIGWLPVIDGEGKLCGVITDRDAAVAAATRGRRMDDIAVATVMSGRVVTCTPDAALEDALALMRAQKVRRLPVVSAEGTPVGVITINDVDRTLLDRPSPAGARAAAATEAVRTLAAITAPGDAGDSAEARS